VLIVEIVDLVQLKRVGSRKSTAWEIADHRRAGDVGRRRVHKIETKHGTAQLSTTGENDSTICSRGAATAGRAGPPPACWGPLAAAMIGSRWANCAVLLGPRDRGLWSWGRLLQSIEQPFPFWWHTNAPGSWRWTKDGTERKEGANRTPPIH
jgi:hypothetical protein